MLSKECFNKKTFFHDIVAGIIVALVSIPISMGYAQVAGLPPVYGLYGSLLPILVYGIFSSSPQFVVGVDAMPAAMVGAGLAEFGIISSTEQAIEIVPAITMLVAIWLIILRIIQAGRVIKYISNPVMGGFISGVGCTIILMQVPKLFGGNAGTGEIIVLIPHIIQQIQFFNLPSLFFGLSTIIIILIFKKIAPKFPMPIFMLVVGIVLTTVFHIENLGVKLLPAVDGGLPKIHFPRFFLLANHFEDCIILSLTIAAVIMAQTLLAANNYATKYDYNLNNNQELVAYSLMNVAGSLVGSCPINGSVSRAGIADQFGCKSQIMSISAAISMLIVILFCTPFFIYLPVPILTGIVMSALIGIIDIKQAKRLWKNSKSELVIFLVAFLGVLFFGTIYGVMIVVILSFVQVVRKAVIPPCSFLGKIPGQHGYYNLKRNKNSVAIKDTIIYRFGGNLFFANIGTFQNDLEKAILPTTKCIIIDASGIGDIDITAADKLIYLADKFKKKNIRFYITEHQGHINDQLRQFGAIKLIEDGNVRRTMSLALRDFGYIKPYPLENGTLCENDTYIEAYEKLAEMEWAFGDEAEERMQQFATEMVNTIQKMDSTEEISNINLEQVEEKLAWGKIGLFDEQELLDHLEIKLEQLVSSGKLGQPQLNELEKLIEKRKQIVESKIHLLNPQAIELLHKRMETVEEHLRKINPTEFQHITALKELLRTKFEEKKE
ncbi:MAG: SulP family inorganic anion transporter [Treponema sp.]|nr:SulP family inorganic anion transporter [Treponema sp.]